MELAAEKLEVLVNQAEVTLNTILFETEKEIESRSGVQIRPAEIISPVEELQKELEELKEASETLLKNHDEVKSQIDKELNVACKKIQNLQSKTGCKSVYSNTVGSALKTHFDKLK